MAKRKIEISNQDVSNVLTEAYQFPSGSFLLGTAIYNNQPLSHVLIKAVFSIKSIKAD